MPRRPDASARPPQTTTPPAVPFVNSADLTLLPLAIPVVLADEPELLALVQERFQVCYPLVTLDCVKHEPDNRFVECALAVDADYLVTVNTARGHFDRPTYSRTRVVTPGAFLNLPDVQQLVPQI